MRINLKYIYVIFNIVLSGCLGKPTDQVNITSSKIAPVPNKTSSIFPSVTIISPVSNSYININNNSPNFLLAGNCSENSAPVIIKINGVDANSQVGGICNGATFSTYIDVTGLNNNTSYSLSAEMTNSIGETTTSSSMLRKWQSCNISASIHLMGCIPYKKGTVRNHQNQIKKLVQQ